MELINRNLKRGLALVMALMLVAPAAALAQQPQGQSALRGQVTDEFGGAIPGATVTAVDSAGKDKSATTDAEGNYAIAGLAPGRYIVRVVAAGFAFYENPAAEVAAGRPAALDVKLAISLEQEEVNVSADAGVDTAPENNADALVLREKDLEALPEDPDELAAALQALAGPSGGPNGGQIFVDGFSGGRMPSRDTIREIRINQNPFTAENDRPGFGGRIEILTRPGTDRLRGTSYFTFMDESLNSRNPFLRSDKRPPFQVRRYGGNVSGPIKPKVASFFIDFERNEDDENDIINALVLDPVTLNATPFVQAVQTPRRRTSFSPRFDYQINTANTLVARYNFFRLDRTNEGLASEFALPERAFDSNTSQHTLQLTETAIINPSVVNETRFQFTRNRNERNGDNSIPAVNVQGAFFGGGAQVGESYSQDTRWELQNNTTWTHGNHSFKAGGRLRAVSIDDFSVANFGGTFTFSSLDQFRNNVAGAAGGAPTQFTLTTGEPLAGVTQYDFGGFINDDWKVRPNLTFSFGLRYENQSNISSNLNFAPRVAMAWSPGAVQGQQPKTVVRAGFGIFYDRVNESLTLQESRFNGEQQQFFVDTRTPVGLAYLSQVRFNADGTVAALPPLAGLAAAPVITRRLDDELRAPYTMFAGLNVERQLSKTFTAFASLGTIRSRHVLRMRNINAPLPGTYNFFEPALSNPVRPFPGVGDIYEFESSGVSNMNQLAVGFNTRLNPSFSIFSNYVFSKTESDTEGGFGAFGGGGLASPSNPYDFSRDYGRASFDIRHRFFLFGNFTVTRYKITLSPFVQAMSGRPFNIFTGLDTNGDTLFTERPSLVSNETCVNRTQVSPTVVCTRLGTFNLNPATVSEMIPRNFGEGPPFFSVNLRVGKTWGFGGGGASAAAAGGQQGGGQGGRGGAAGGGARGGQGGGGPVAGGGGRVMVGPGGGPFGGGAENRYSINLSVQVSNIFNRVNLGQPVGNLQSRDFGNPISVAQSFGFGGGGASAAAGNRTIQAQLRFNF
jgi:hypothetical protein